MRTQPLTVRADDGASVFVHRWLPDAAVRGIVQIVHGLAEHGARYRRLAERLVTQGWAVYASDHRGHGKTAIETDALGHFADEDGWNRVIADLRTVASEARREHPGVPLVLFGHSMGSFLASTWALAHPRDIDALVLSASTIGGGPLVLLGRQIAKLERIRQGKRGKSALLFQMSFGDFNRGFEGRTSHDWLSRDPIEVDLYERDPLCGFRGTNQLWIDLLGGLIELGRAEWSRLRDVPILVFAGALDPVGGRGKGVEALVAKMRVAGLTKLETHLYPEGRHEMLNEVNRDEVMNDVVRWLEDNVPRQSASAARVLS